MALKFNPTHKPNFIARRAWGEPFSSPKPCEGEQMSAYVARLAEAFEQWANRRVPPSGEPSGFASRTEAAVAALRTQGWEGGHPLNVWDDAERIVGIVRSALEASDGR